MLHNSPFVMVLSAIFKNEVVGPFSRMRISLAGHTKRVLSYFLLPRLQGCTEDMNFQQAGAPPDNSSEKENIWTKRYRIDGWEEAVQLSGLHALQILLLAQFKKHNLEL